MDVVEVDYGVDVEEVVVEEVVVEEVWWWGVFTFWFF